MPEQAACKPLNGFTGRIFMDETECGCEDTVCVGLRSDACYEEWADLNGSSQAVGLAIAQREWMENVKKDTWRCGLVDSMQTACLPCAHNQQAACKPIAEFTGRLFGMKRMYWFTNG